MPLRQQRWVARPPSTEVGRTPLIDAERIFALDAHVGVLVSLSYSDATQRLWDWRSPSDIRNFYTAGGMALASVDSLNLIVLVTGDGGLHALHRDSGKTLWHVRPNASSSDTFIGPPTISGPRVFVKSLNGTAIAYNLTNGAFIWATLIGFTTDDWALANAAIAVAADGEALFIATLGGGPFASPIIVSLRATTGVQLWLLPVTRVDRVPSSALVCTESAIFFGCPAGAAAISATNGSVLWVKSPTGDPADSIVTGAPVYSRRHKMIFVSLRPGLFGLDLETGNNRWYSPNAFSSVAGALDSDGVLYFINDLGELGAFDASNGRMLGLVASSMTLGSSSPALDGDSRLVVFSAPMSTLIVFGAPPAAAQSTSHSLAATSVVAIVAGGGVLLALFIFLCRRAASVGVAPPLEQPRRELRSVGTSFSEWRGLREQLIPTSSGSQQGAGSTVSDGDQGEAGEAEREQEESDWLSENGSCVDFQEPTGVQLKLTQEGAVSHDGDSYVIFGSVGREPGRVSPRESGELAKRLTTI